MNEQKEKLSNKYFDNEISSDELKTFKELIDSDPELLKNLKTVKFIEETISNSEIRNAPDGFTDKLMLKINHGIKSVKQDSKFFKLIISIFAILILGIFSTAFAIADWGNTDLTTQFKEYVDGVSFDGIITFLQNENFLFVCGGIIIILGFTVMLIYESHKSFKHKLNTYLQ